MADNMVNMMREKKSEPVLSEYDLKAEKFMSDTGTSMKVEFLAHDHYFPGDKDRRDIYRITLTRGQRSYTFKFGQSMFCSGRFVYHGSIGKIVTNNHAELNKQAKRYVSLGECIINKDQCEPSAYDILAALTKHDPGTLAEFCSEFGYDTDSKLAEKIYNSVVDEYRNIRILFSDAEIEQLQEIN